MEKREYGLTCEVCGQEFTRPLGNDRELPTPKACGKCVHDATTARCHDRFPANPEGTIGGKK